MGTIVTFHQQRGVERTFVARADEQWWIGWWARGGVPAARLADYERWGHRFWPTDRDRRVMLRREWDGS